MEAAVHILPITPTIRLYLRLAELTEQNGASQLNQVSDQMDHPVCMLWN